MWVYYNPKGSDKTNARTKILNDRYLFDGETEQDMYKRVAKAASQGDEDKFQNYFHIMSALYFLPNTPTLVNLGKGTGTSSACFALGVEDSREGIMKALDHQAAIHHAFGGTGFWLGDIRPKGDPIKSTGGEACGPIEVIKTLNQNAAMIRQGGRREGANMGILPIWHPDIEEFITLKTKGTIWEELLSHFNLSVGITDDFMKAVEGDKEWWLTFNGIKRKRVAARYLYELIIHHMHDSGDPGVIFLDTIERTNPTPNLGTLRMTNPCVVGDTYIQTVEGEIKIKNLIGQEIDVYCMDKDTGELTISHAFNIRKTRKNANLVKVVTSRQDIICTPDHMFYTKNRGWVEAHNLRQSDKLVGINRAPRNQKYVKAGLTGKNRVIKVEVLDYTEDVYDLTVDTHHNFIANGIVIHNCGEQPLLNYEACNLGSIDVSKFVTIAEHGQNIIDYDHLGYVVQIATNFLDDIIDVNTYPLPEIEEAVLMTRKIGLGIMGLHDMLIKMGKSYASEEGRKIAGNVMEFVTTTAVEESKKIATKKGTFIAWDGSLWCDDMIRIRNASITTIAPTGTLSTIAGCSHGIEPIYQWEYERTVESGTFVTRHYLYELAKERGLLEDALSISPEDHILMQATLQAHTHNAVSKTINIPNDTSEIEISHLLTFAWKQGCKGFTIYRDGSKNSQVFNEVKDTQCVVKGSKNDETEQVKIPIVVNGIQVRNAKVYEANSGCGTLRVVIDDECGKMHETFVITAGGCSSNNEAIGRLISMEMQANGNIGGLSKSLHKVKCINATRNPESVGRSCADVIAKCIDMHDSVDDEPLIIQSISSRVSKNNCPDCGVELNFAEGCSMGTCYNCGWSGCN